MEDKNLNKTTKMALPPITSAFFVLTQACNLKCKYCFVVQKPRVMSYEVARRAADFLARNALKTGDKPHINFFGGEPLLRWHEVIVPLTLYIRETYGQKFGLSMTTNGLLLDEPKLIFMRKHGIGFMVSMDGARETQDLNRPCSSGGSSFEVLAPRIPMFLRYNPKMTFRATVDHDNAAAFLANHQFAFDQGYQNMFSIVNVFSPWTEEEKATLKEQMRLVGELYLSLLAKGCQFSIHPLEGMFEKIRQAEQARAKGHFRTAGEHLPAFGRCGLGASKFASVGTDGSLYSCQEMCDNDELGAFFKIGNIDNGASDERRWSIIGKFNPKTVISSDQSLCSDCPMYMICDGACTINNYFASGNLNVMPSILCFYYRCLYEEAKRIQAEATKATINPTILRKRGIIR